MSRLILKLRATPQPVIAAVNGPAAGFGFALALGSDIRYAAAAPSSAPSSSTSASRTATWATSWLLPRLIGASRSHELMLTGAPRARADEAERIGLVAESSTTTRCSTARSRPPSRSPPGAVGHPPDEAGHVVGARDPSEQAAIEYEDRQQIMALHCRGPGGGHGVPGEAPGAVRRLGPATRCRRSGAPCGGAAGCGRRGRASRRSAPRVSAGSMTSSSSNSVAALSAFAFSWAAAVRSRTRCSRSASSSIASSSLRSAEPHRALEAHRPEVGGRPGDGQQRLVQAAGRPSPARRGRSRGAGSRRRAARAARAPATSSREVWRTRPVASASGPTIIPGVSTSETIGSPNASQSCRKRAALSAASLVIAPAMCSVLLAITPSGAALDPRQRGRPSPARSARAGR